MNTTEFTDHKLNDIMLKLSLGRNKKIYIAGDSNFDLLKTSTGSDTSNFYNKISSNLLIPQIALPTKINEKNNTLIDNIFAINLILILYPGNLTVS